MKKIKCSPCSAHCEIANRWTIDLACCRLSKCHADEECFGHDGTCRARCTQSGCGRKASAFVKRGSIKPIGMNSHVRRLRKDGTSCLLDDHQLLWEECVWSSLNTWFQSKCDLFWTYGQSIYDSKFILDLGGSQGE